MRAFEEAQQILPQESEIRMLLKGAEGNLARFTSSSSAMMTPCSRSRRTFPSATPRNAPITCWPALFILVRAGRCNEAVEHARSLERETGLDSVTLYNLACVYSLAVAATQSDSRLDHARKSDLARSYAAEAIRLLARSHRDGKFPSKELLDLLRKDADMEPIRGTPEFKNLVEQIAR